MTKLLSSTATVVPSPAPLAAPTRGVPVGTLLQRLGQRLLYRALEQWTVGELTVLVPSLGARRVFGRRGAAGDLQATLEILHPQAFADVAFGGSVGGGEAYMRGYWRSPDLTTLVRAFVANREALAAVEGTAAFGTGSLRRALHWLNRNSVDGSRRNIAAHYDLGNEFFALFLDETMAYSCAVFERDDASLEEAQVAKFERICRKLRLAPGEHLLEIGTGWGGLALHAAQRYGCRVTTTTLSREQHDYARERFERSGLIRSGQVTLLLDDYRDLRGTYDKVVSVEMVEAVGHQYLDTYLRRCSSLLVPHGALLLQAITLQDQLYAQALRSVDFIQRHVFPGSFIPSISALVDSVRRCTDLKLFELDDIGPHYATTLRHWRERFTSRLDEVRALGYPDHFIRLWQFYLCYCEGGFLERQLGDVQALFTKPGCRMRPVT